MRDYDFDRKVFDNHWAFPFTALQYIFLIGFVLMCIAVALGAMTDLWKHGCAGREECLRGCEFCGTLHRRRSS